MIKKLVVALGAVLFIAGPAAAQAPGGEGRGRLAACRTDLATFCQTAEAGRGRRMACLAANKARLSPACAQVVEARGGDRAERRGLGAAAPVDAPAPSIRPGSGAALPEASPTASPRRVGRGGGRLAACKTDLATFCQSAEAGGGGRAKCLKQNEASLSPDCRSAVSQQVLQARELRTACKSDRATLCGGVERGGGRILQCLRANQAKLSPSCGAILAQRPERGRAARKADAGGAPIAR